MIVTTKAIVLSAVKYGDSDLIVKCYTELGIKSYLLKRILKSKSGKLKVAYFQPLTLLEIVANHSNKGQLNYIKEAKVSHPYNTIFKDIVKQTIVLFLSEVLSKSIKEEETNNLLFTYIETALIWLDTNNETSNFHLLFLLKLTKHLGFYPETENYNALYFNLQEGYFTNSLPKQNYISDKKLLLFKQLIGINFDDLHTLKISGADRQVLLDLLLNYFQLHLPIFSKPKSLTILKTVFT